MTDNTAQHEQIKSNMKNSHNWQRLLFMALFAILLQLASAVMWVLCSIQFLFSLLTGQDNENLRQLGSSIASFVHQALQYLSYNTDDKPFPFGAWPEPLERESEAGDSAPNEPVTESNKPDEDIIEGEVIEIAPTPNGNSEGDETKGDLK